MADDARQQAFDALTEVGEAIEAGHGADAARAAERLRETFTAQPPDAALPGFGAMVLDAALWLMAGGRDADALELCEALIARLDPAAPAEPPDAGRAIAAGARFLAAQAAARLGDPDNARRQLQALTAMGEPALAGLERMAGRLAASGAGAAWHAQVAAATVTVLWRVGRATEARAFAQETAASFERIGEPALQRRLLALEREIAGAGD